VDAAVAGKANAIAPGKRPLSSMTPTIVLKDGKPVLVVGTPGGSRIITTVLEIIVNVIDHGMTLQEAVGIAPADAAQAKALGFPRPGMIYGASDSRAPAGSAAAP
jgi:gamma-glutamyltranspeptidase